MTEAGGAKRPFSWRDRLEPCATVFDGFQLGIKHRTSLVFGDSWSDVADHPGHFEVDRGVWSSSPIADSPCTAPQAT
jgi:hypothetical protein